MIIGTLALNTPEFLAQIPADNPDWMMPVFILNYLPHGLIGLLVVAILAAAMSSLSSAINSLSAVTIEDYQRLSGRKFSEQQYLRLAKGIGLFWGAMTLLLSLFADDIAPTIIEAINKVGSMFYGPILAVFLLALFNRNINALSVNVGIITGVVGNAILWLYFPDVFWFWWNLIGFAVTLIVSFIARLIFPHTTPSQGANDAAQNAASTLPNWQWHSILTARDVSILLAFFAIILGVCVMLPSLISN